jgi:4-aminobutyrate aminotransferase / (S)-3-amino-2-methylpropionate transaminase / 5-aminovalerate transaminase
MSAGENAKWRDREAQVLAAAMLRDRDPMFGPVIVHGAGARVWDAEQREYLDLTCGYSAANFGHAFEPFAQAAERQLRSLTHLTGRAHRGRIELAERLLELCAVPGRDERVIFNTSGSRAIESAWKAAISYRPGRIVSLGPAYHGRSIATSHVSDTQRVPARLLEAAAFEQRPHDEYAYCAACPLPVRYPQCELRCQHTLWQWLELHHREISAILVEPALGARGYIQPPAEVWRQLRQRCTHYGVLLIADEIQMGLGRCGDWLLSRRQGWDADLVVLGKSLGGGIAPISAVLGRREVLAALPAESESETFAASPLAVAVALEVLAQLQHGPWLRRADTLGAQLHAALAQTRQGALVVEQLGAAAVVEWIGGGDQATAAAAARRWAQACLAAGLLVHYGGPLGTRVALIPPLTITDAELHQATSRLPELASDPN